MIYDQGRFNKYGNGLPPSGWQLPEILACIDNKNMLNADILLPLPYQLIVDIDKDRIKIREKPFMRLAIYKVFCIPPVHPNSHLYIYIVQGISFNNYLSKEIYTSNA